MQQMIVNRKSWHYKYNCYFYGMWETTQVKDGCRYFWKTVLACLLAPLLGIVELCQAIHERMPVFPDVSMPTISDETKGRIESLLGSFGLVLAIMATIIPCEFGYGWYVLKFYACIAGILGIGFLAVLSAFYLKEIWDGRPQKEKPIKEKTPNMVWQMVKAKKNKYCPKLVIT